MVEKCTSGATCFATERCQWRDENIIWTHVFKTRTVPIESIEYLSAGVLLYTCARYIKMWFISTIKKCLCGHCNSLIEEIRLTLYRQNQFCIVLPDWLFCEFLSCFSSCALAWIFTANATGLKCANLGPPVAHQSYGPAFHPLVVRRALGGQWNCSSGCRSRGGSYLELPCHLRHLVVVLNVALNCNLQLA